MRRDAESCVEMGRLAAAPSCRAGRLTHSRFRHTWSKIDNLASLLPKVTKSRNTTVSLLMSTKCPPKAHSVSVFGFITWFGTIFNARSSLLRLLVWRWSKVLAKNCRTVLHKSQNEFKMIASHDWPDLAIHTRREHCNGKKNQLKRAKLIVWTRSFLRLKVLYLECPTVVFDFSRENTALRW